MLSKILMFFLEIIRINSYKTVGYDLFVLRNP